MTNSSEKIEEGSHVRRKNIQRIYGDMPSFMGVPYVSEVESARGDAVVLGMPYDGIASFRGGPNRLGPQEIRKMSLLYGDYNIEWDIALSEHISIVDVGDVNVWPGHPAASFKQLEHWVGCIKRNNAVPVLLGGDHAVTYPSVKAVSEHTSGRALRLPRERARNRGKSFLRRVDDQRPSVRDRRKSGAWTLRRSYYAATHDLDVVA